MVGWFVKQKNVRFLKQKTGQDRTHFPPTAQFLQGNFKRLKREPETEKDLFSPVRRIQGIMVIDFVIQVCHISGQYSLTFRILFTVKIPFQFF